ncbi:MAG: helix-turn-helix domain-containing protein [Acholeplasmatales bacterium]|nr:helix-turn-helix domain-containing protein [Acholeplasmatales bacterium]
MNIEIANRLVELRKKYGYSQEELAAKLGVSRQAVSKWERSESSPDTDNLIVLAKLYNVSLDSLLDTSEPIEETIERVEETQNVNVIDKENGDNKPIWLSTLYGLSMLVATIAYLLIGFISKDPLRWAVWWILYLIALVICSIPEAIYYKKASKFNMAVLCTAVFIYIGFYFTAWHPGWVVFLLIPVYHTFCGIFEHKKNQ